MSISRASSISASRRAVCREGKAGLWLGEGGRNVFPERRLVLLDWEHVISSSFDDLRTKITVREHCVTRDDLVLDRDHSQNFQGGLVLVGLGIDPESSQDRFDVRGEAGEQVNARRVAVSAPPGSLAVDRGVRGVVFAKLGLNPPAHTRLEVNHVDPAKDPRVSRLREAPLGCKPEKLQKLPAPFLAELDDSLIAGHPRKRADNRQAEEHRKRMPLPLGTSRILKSLKEFPQRSLGFHA